MRRPKAWTNLLDPKWKDRSGLPSGIQRRCGCLGPGDPETLRLRYFRTLAANDPRIGRSTRGHGHTAKRGRVSGRPDLGARSLSTSTGETRSRITQPNDGAVVMVFPSAIPAHAPHPNAARLFHGMAVEPSSIRNWFATDRGSEPAWTCRRARMNRRWTGRRW